MFKVFSIGPVVTCWGLHQPEYMIKTRNKKPSFGICVSNYVKDWATTLSRRRYDKYYQYLLIVILCVCSAGILGALQFHLLTSAVFVLNNSQSSRLSLCVFRFYAYDTVRMTLLYLSNFRDYLKSS